MLSCSIGNKYESFMINTDSTKGVNFYLKNDTLMAHTFLK